MTRYHKAWFIINKETGGLAVLESTGQMMVYKSPEEAYKFLFSIKKPRQDCFEVHQGEIPLPWKD